MQTQKKFHEMGLKNIFKTGASILVFSLYISFSHGAEAEANPQPQTAENLMITDQNTTQTPQDLRKKWQPERQKRLQDRRDRLGRRSALRNRNNPTITGMPAETPTIPAAPPLDVTPNVDPQPLNPAPKKDIIIKTKDWGDKYKDVEQVFAQASKDRKDIKDIRNKYLKEYQKTDNHQQTMKNITRDTKVYVANIMKEEMAKMGPLPGNLDVVSMGSLAREESGPFTDLEILFLVDAVNPNTLDYLNKFSQKLADRFYLLGEHPDVGGKGFRMDEADNSPLHNTFPMRYASPETSRKALEAAIISRNFADTPYEGSRVLVVAPETLANYSDPHFLDENGSATDTFFKERYAIERKKPENSSLTNQELGRKVADLIRTDTTLKIPTKYTAREQQIIKNLVVLLRNTTLIYGQGKLYKDYLDKRNNVLKQPPMVQHPMVDTRRQEIARNKMIAEEEKYWVNIESLISSGKLGEKVDLKRELYRQPEQILTNLGYYYDVPTQNTIDIADYLEKTGVMSKKIAADAKNLMNFALGLRLKKQDVLGKQGYAIYIDQQAWEKDLKKLTDIEDALERKRDFNKNLGKPAAFFAEIDAQISQTKQKIADHQAVAPGKILNEDDIKKINAVYIPILKELSTLTKDWMSGNTKAYLK